MSFQIKNFTEIVADEIESVRGLTSLLSDFNVGSVVRSILEAHAVSIEDVYMAMYTNLTDAIPIAIYSAFNFGRLPAVYATGSLEIVLGESYPADLTIPSGSRFKTLGGSVEYVTTEDLTIAENETVGIVNVFCSTIGAIGNTLADTIQVIVSDGGVSRLAPYTVTNHLPFVNGHDEENDSARKSRFIEFVNSFSRATNVALTYAAKLAVLYDASGRISEYVTRVGLEELRPGRVNIYIASGVDEPSDELVQRAQQIIDGYTTAEGTIVSGYSAAGILVTVKKTAPLLVNLSGTIYLKSGYSYSDVYTRVLAAFDRHLSTIDPGGVLYRSNIMGVMSLVEGVAGVDITIPAQNISLDINKTAYRGTTQLSLG